MFCVIHLHLHGVITEVSKLQAHHGFLYIDGWMIFYIGLVTYHINSEMDALRISISKNCSRPAKKRKKESKNCSNLY